MFYSEDLLHKLCGKKLGQGNEKECFCHSLDPSRCIKISKRTKCHQVLREISYFNYLKKRGINAFFLPQYFGRFETPNFIGMEQECFLDKAHGGTYDSVTTLQQYISSSPNNDEIVKLLKHLKEEMIRKNIICIDMHGYNILRVVKGNDVRLVLIDGFGPTEHIPLPKYFKLFGYFKIMRHWRKLEKRLVHDFGEDINKILKQIN